MTIPFILGHLLLPAVLLLAALARPGTRSRAAILRRRIDPDPIRPEYLVLNRLPDGCTLAGIPFPLLLSERSRPGASLRDIVTNEPSKDDR
jgi:hypothetical protein